MERMTTEHRKAPRREVVDIRRVGGWGQVKYHHVLSCGHIETRPRASSSPKLACVDCLRTEKLVSEMKAIPAPTRVQVASDDEMASLETEVSIMRATIATRFGVPIESVDLVTTDDAGILRVRYATVFLTEKDVTRVTKNTEA